MRRVCAVALFSWRWWFELAAHTRGIYKRLDDDETAHYIELTFNCVSSKAIKGWPITRNNALGYFCTRIANLTLVLTNIAPCYRTFLAYADHAAYRKNRLINKQNETRLSKVLLLVMFLSIKVSLFFRFCYGAPRSIARHIGRGT